MQRGGYMVKKTQKHEDKNPFISIPTSLAGIFLVVVLIFLIFAPSSIYYISSIVWAFAVLGIFACFFALLAMKKK